MAVHAIPSNRSRVRTLPANREKNRQAGESRRFQPISGVENTICLRGLGRNSLLAITRSIPARFREPRTGIQRV